MRILFAVVAAFGLWISSATPVLAQAANTMCFDGATWKPCTAANPLATTGSGPGGTTSTTQGTTPWVIQRPDTQTTGNTINSATPNAAYTVTLGGGEAILSFSVVGLTAAAATLTIEASDDGGGTWAAVNGIAPATGILFTTLTADQQFRVNAAGRSRVRLRVSSTGTGTITVASDSSSATGAVAMSSPMPPGTNSVGQVTANAGSNLNTSALATTANVIATQGTVAAGAAPTNMVVGGAVYNSTKPTLTTGQSAALQLSVHGDLLGMIRDAAGNDRGANVDANNNLGVVLPAETTKVIGTARILGNAGATLDATVVPGTPPTNMQIGGGIYNVTAPAPTDGQSLGLQLDETGRLRTTAQPASANMVTGTANTTGNSTTSLVSLVSAKRLYITAFSCANTGSTTSLISFQDGSGGTTLWTTIVPAGGGTNIDGNQPLFKTTSGNALFFVPASASTTIYCSAAGYSGS